MNTEKLSPMIHIMPAPDVDRYLDRLGLTPPDVPVQNFMGDTYYAVKDLATVLTDDLLKTLQIEVLTFISY